MLSSTLLYFIWISNLLLLRLSDVRAALCTESICEYDFVITRTQTMTYTHSSGTVFNVELNHSSLVVVANSLRLRHAYPDVIGKVVEPSYVITADGFPRDIIVINNQFPGPTIEVLEEAEVIVRVHNNLMSETTSIHWHGLRMLHTNFMDGVPYVTQCPILPRQLFTYRFKADPVGTHWYHSHQGNQRIDGLYGMLVVHPRLVPIPPFHGIFVTDWNHLSGDALALRSGSFQRNRFTGEILQHPSLRYYSLDGVELTSLSYVSALLGGRGRYDDRPFPLKVYNLISGKSNVFRLINAAADFSFEISADNHRLNITSLDGYKIRPITVDSAVLHPGESIDFEIHADQTPSLYWLRAETLLDNIGQNKTKNHKRQEVRAILAYSEFAAEVNDPKSEPRSCTKSQPCVVFNCIFPDFPTKYNKTCKNINDVQSINDLSWLQSEYGLHDDNPIVEVFLNFAFIGGSSVNGRKFIPPRGYSNTASKWDDHYIVPCDEKNCKKESCSCTNILSLPQDVTVQMTLMNYQPVFDPRNLPSHHSIHIHGHSFAVLATGFGMRDVTSGSVVSTNKDISCESNLCIRPQWTNNTPPHLNLVHPPVKDTVFVPAQGYVIIRFRTDNPGQWMVHCHQELHFLKGMALILDEGNVADLPKLPDGFQSCGDFNLYKDYIKRATSEAPQEKLEPTLKQDINIVTAHNTKGLFISYEMAVGAAVGFTMLGAFLAAALLIIRRIFMTKHTYVSRMTRRERHNNSPKHDDSTNGLL